MKRGRGEKMMKRVKERSLTKVKGNKERDSSFLYWQRLAVIVFFFLLLSTDFLHYFIVILPKCRVLTLFVFSY